MAGSDESSWPATGGGKWLDLQVMGKSRALATDEKEGEHSNVYNDGPDHELQLQAYLKAPPLL